MADFERDAYEVNMNLDHELLRAELCGEAQACADFLERQPQRVAQEIAIQELIKSVAKYRAKMAALDGVKSAT